jgi:hypothetical protein
LPTFTFSLSYHFENSQLEKLLLFEKLDFEKQGDNKGKKIDHDGSKKQWRMGSFLLGLLLTIQYMY